MVNSAFAVHEKTFSHFCGRASIPEGNYRGFLKKKPSLTPRNDVYNTLICRNKQVLSKRRMGGAGHYVSLQRADCKTLLPNVSADAVTVFPQIFAVAIEYVLAVMMSKS